MPYQIPSFSETPPEYRSVIRQFSGLNAQTLTFRNAFVAMARRQQRDRKYELAFGQSLSSPAQFYWNYSLR